MPLTPARGVADWRERLDRVGGRAMTVVGDWLSPGERVSRSEPRISALVAVVAVAGGVLPILVMAVTWAAKPDPVAHVPACRVAHEMTGYVLADRPAEDRYQPDRQCNSADAPNTVERTGTGRYLVVFGKLGRDGGVAAVTPVTGDDRICTLPDWRPEGADELVQVDCFDRSGAAADSGFTAHFWDVSPGGETGGTAAYLRLGDPGRTSQTVEDAYSHNSAGGANSAGREDVGSYVVYFGGLEAVEGGTVRVTPVADAATVCGVERWFAYPEGRYLAARVRCRDAGGQPVDARFAVTFTLGVGAPGVAGAHVLADRPAEASYTPEGVAQFSSGGQAAAVTRSEPGEYRVELPGLALKSGNLQVTAYDTAASCVARTATGDVRITCRDPSGAAADTKFLLTYWD
ncbi:hypothetical protein [Actinoplanes palleronii]|uniref:hypothetical protein n=1 Tax=Actinoplanes palleronii TaxID=113570 RepID=UPI0019431999|nr:hypothetical protein [Actinoplanes palleronii]